MRLDHIAYRVADRHKTAKFFMEIFDYRFDEALGDDGFDVNLEDGKIAKCLVLVPPTKPIGEEVPWSNFGFFQKKEEEPKKFLSKVYKSLFGRPKYGLAYYDMAPEIFISDSKDDTVIKRWVENRGGVGGIHHLAYQVEDVKKMMNFMKEKGYAEFTTEEPLSCPGLTQVFTKPSELTGVIYEFIKRDKQGFCKENVKDLMNSTKDIK